PAALHFPFKVTWAYESLHKPDLLLDPRMDNWGQGTFTLSVSPPYRRAIGIASKAILSRLYSLGPCSALRVDRILLHLGVLVQESLHAIECDVEQHGTDHCPLRGPADRGCAHFRLYI